jgi:hypothetical protein
MSDSTVARRKELAAQFRALADAIEENEHGTLYMSHNAIWRDTLKKPGFTGSSKTGEEWTLRLGARMPGERRLDATIVYMEWWPGGGDLVEGLLREDESAFVRRNSDMTS